MSSALDKQQSSAGDEAKKEEDEDTQELTNQNTCGNGLPSYFLQRQLNVNANIANDFFSVVEKGDIQAVKMKEGRIGLDVQYQVDAYGKNAIFAAVACPDEHKAIKMTNWLASKGCKITLIDNLGQSCLFYVARDGKLALARCLIELSVDINHTDTYGQTAFFYACREGHLDICKLLADCGTDVDL